MNWPLRTLMGAFLFQQTRVGMDIIAGGLAGTKNCPPTAEKDF